MKSNRTSKGEGGQDVRSPQPSAPTAYQKTYQQPEPKGRVWLHRGDVAQPEPQGRVWSHRVGAAQPDVAKGRFRSTSGLMVSGIVMVALGSIGVLAAVVFELVGLLAGMFFDVPGVMVAVLFGVCLVAFAALLGFGIRNLVQGSHVRTFQRVFGTSEVLTFRDIAARAHIGEAQARKRARKLIKRGYIPQGHIDDEGTSLMVTEEAYRHYLQLKQSQRQLLEQQQAAARANEQRAAEQAARDRALADRMTPTQRDFLACGRDFQAQLRELDKRIDDAAVSERIVAIVELVDRILARVEEEPALIAGLDRLTAYYLPTTVKLLEAYESLEDQPVQGENISNSRREIEKTLEVLRAAFEKLLDDTYHEMSLDVSTDISVLHSVLAREGLAESPFDMKP